jgi:hypothetical protein
MSTDCIIDELHSLISSLSFDEYVLIDYLKTGERPTKTLQSRLYTLDFIALTEKGFLNIYDEITSAFASKEFINSSIGKYELILLDDQAVFFKGSNITIIIKYTNKNIVDLISLPGLDFYKCYYDGVKIHCTPEAIQCYKTNKIRYVGKINPISIFTPVKIYPDYFCLSFEEEFWKNNKKYNFPAENRYKQYNVNREQVLCADLVFLRSIKSLSVNQYKQEALEFIKKYIFTNPVSTLC